MIIGIIFAIFVGHMIADTYKYKSDSIALYLIAIANDKKISVNITKIQKLLYIVYGTFLRVYSIRLIDEHPQAWPYGPVFPTTRNVIKRKIASEELEYPMSQIGDDIKSDAELKKVIDFVMTHFGVWNAGQLTEWSHRDGSPWDLTVKQDGFKWGDTISDTLILEFFTKLIRVKE